MVTILLKDWFQYCARYYSPRTCQHYKSALLQFDKYLSQDGRKITSEAIERYIDFKLQENWSNRTVNANLTAIKSYCRWLSEHRNIENPAKSVQMLKEKPPNQRVLNEKEYHKLLSVASGIEKQIIQFIGNTGLRRSEFHSLTWDSVSSDYKLLTIVGKGGKSRTIPLNDVCRDILLQFKPNGDKIPIAKRFACASNYSFMCKRLAAKAKIPRFGLHAIRHFFCTRLLRQGVPIYKVSKILGHSA